MESDCFSSGVVFRMVVLGKYKMMGVKMGGTI